MLRVESRILQLECESNGRSISLKLSIFNELKDTETAPRQ